MTSSIADLQRRIARLTRARDEERRRAANPLQVRVWLPAKDGVDYNEPMPYDRGDGVVIYIHRESEEEAFNAWMNEQERRQQ